MIKRGIDFFVSLIGLIFFFPILIIISCMILINMGLPIIYIQKRPGLDGKIFAFYKFRTMTSERNSKGDFLQDKYRITKFGKWLRKTSLDELPNLWNVIIGNMSLVGPRPLLIEYLPLYTSKQKRRHEVKPGITGWAQVNGRNSITWEEKFDLDIWYVDNHTFFLDIKILFLTIKKVLLREGINSQTSATMEKFNGSIPK